MDIVKNYLRTKNINPLPQDELSKLIRRAHNKNNGHVKATNKIIQHNLGLVAREARKWAWSMPFDDAFQQGVLGLYSAIRKYQPECNFHFSTYATIWIKQAIGRYWAQTKDSVRRPDYIVGIQRRFEKLKALDNEETDDFWIKYIARESGTPQSSISFAVRNNHTSLSLDYVNEEGDEPLQIGEIDKHDNLDGIDAQKLLSYLNEDDRKILTMRMNGHTFEEIAAEYGLSRERIRQRQDNALRKIRAILRKTREIYPETATDDIAKSGFRGHISRHRGKV